VVIFTARTIPMTQHIHIVEDDVSFGTMLASFLKRKGFDVDISLSGASAREQMKKKAPDFLITDLKLPDDSGLELLNFSKKLNPTTKVILMTGYAEVDTAVKAIKRGAIDYISKPFRPEELLMVIRDSEPIKSQTLGIEQHHEKKTPPEKSSFVMGISQVSKKFNEYLKLVGPTEMNVLIEGESGTGKEVAARAIHDYSKRRQNSFIAVDCGAIPNEIAASEFFGHIKGSFTGAITDKTGHFKAADGGTLFLDEIGNLSYENQIQLLRALQERKIKPVGSNMEIEVDVRIVAATNENLVEAVAEGRFREDLYHRLNEFSIEIPPLRERRDDLFLFIEYFLEQANVSLNKNVISLSKEVKKAFEEYTWPGNLRELKNVIKRAVLLTPGSEIPAEVIPKEVLNPPQTEIPANEFSIEARERQLILKALKETGNNKTKAAQLLNFTRKTLYNKMAYYGIDL